MINLILKNTAMVFSLSFLKNNRQIRWVLSLLYLTDDIFLQDSKEFIS